MITEEPPYTPALSTVCRGLYCHCRESCHRYHAGVWAAKTGKETAPAWLSDSAYDHSRGRCEYLIKKEDR